MRAEQAPRILAIVLNWQQRDQNVKLEHLILLQVIQNLLIGVKLLEMGNTSEKAHMIQWLKISIDCLQNKLFPTRMLNLHI